MYDKTLGVVALALSAASQVSIRHYDTALFFSVVFFVVGVYELVLGELKERKPKQGEARGAVHPELAGCHESCETPNRVWSKYGGGFLRRPKTAKGRASSLQTGQNL